MLKNAGEGIAARIAKGDDEPGRINVAVEPNGANFAYRITDSVQDFPNFSVFGEAVGIILQKDRADGERNPNSGGATIYLSPGFRVRFNSHASLTIAPAFPVLQDLNGDQVETRFKLGMSLSLSF